MRTNISQFVLWLRAMTTYAKITSAICHSRLFFCFYCSRKSFRLIGVKNICCSSFFPCWSSPKLLFASDLYSFEVDAWRLVLSPLCYGCKTTPNLARILLNSTEHFPDKDEKPLSLASRGAEDQVLRAKQDFAASLVRSLSGLLDVLCLSWIC